MQFFLAGVITAAALFVLGLISAPLRGGPPARDDQRQRATELLAVRELERRIAATTDLRVLARCYERLLDLHARLGQLDRAVQAGLRCRALLANRLPGWGNEGRLGSLDLRLGECYRSLGYYRTAEKYLEGALAVAGRVALPPVQRVVALTELAHCAERRGDSTRAGRLWGQVEEAARMELDRAEPALRPEERIDCARRLADAYRFRGKPARAIARLTPLLALHDRLGDRAGKCDTLRRLAGHHAALGKLKEAEATLRQALALAEDRTAVQRVARGDLAAELAETLARQKHPESEVARWLQRAAADYRSVLVPPKSEDQVQVAPVLTAFWRLQKLYQKTSQYRRALQLAETQSHAWAGVALDDPKLRSEQGTLEIILGSFAPARHLLRVAVHDLEAQSPVSLIDLPRALNNLAVVEEATGDADRAAALANRCLDLYRTHGLPDDLLVIEAYNVLGTCAAVRGQYARAIDHFRDGLARCDKLGERAFVQRSSLLLNVALLHKSQGDTAEALTALEEALAIYKRYAAPDALGFAAFDAARASLYAAQQRLEAALALTPRILSLCKKYEIETGPLLVTARHCEGLYHLSREEFAAAERAWDRVEALQEKEKSAPLRPRTLNYLGLTRELQGRLKEAEELYTRAEGLQRDNPHAFPVTRFISLWRLAGLADRTGRRARARRLLEEAVGVVEDARLRTYGGARQRAAYFAQFAPGFEQLIEHCVRDGDVEAAFAAVTRSRSRTLLDQLRLAGVDPRAGIKGMRGDELRRQEAALRARISGLRARAQLLPLEAATQARAKKLLGDLDDAERRYAVVWREVLNASPAYRGLAADDPSRDLLKALRAKTLGPRTLLLVYHIGRERSHLLLLGGPSFKPEAFALTVPAGVAARVATLKPPETEAALRHGRGITLERTRRQPAVSAAAESAGPTTAVPLGQEVASALVDHYRRQIADPDFRPTRGIELVPRRRDRPVPPQSAALLGDVLVPAAVRRRIRDHGAECVVVVPDGPLHKLPLEGVLLQTAPRPRYVLDELPPLVYAPSAAALALLGRRPPPAGPWSLLTVSNPAYPQAKGDVPAGNRAGTRGLLGLQGQLPLLKGTARESRRLQAFFEPARVTALEGPRATERAVTAAVGGKRVVHLAAHGFADDRFGNLFGALALTPPPPGAAAPDNDGFLSLHEIYALPLQDCELAVLSACMTNVGPQQPLEAGVTLASGFLAAGARRVVASHWSVDDESTVKLMGTFFEEITAARKRGGTLSYARALQTARQKVRSRPEWSAPFHWAPFVLIGPAE